MHQEFFIFVLKIVRSMLLHIKRKKRNLCVDKKLTFIKGAKQKFVLKIKYNKIDIKRVLGILFGTVLINVG